MGAALQFALRHGNFRHQLLAAIVGLELSEVPPEFARRLAKVAGIVQSYWPDTEMLELLEKLCSIPLARDEALFELGMSKLGQGLDSENSQIADAAFDEARAHFEGAVTAREHRPDAVVYATALSMLTSLRRGDDDDALRQKAAIVSETIDVSRLWSRTEESPWTWTGNRASELARWSILATRIGAIGTQVTSFADANAELSLRQDLLGTYIANRVVLHRCAVGVETLIQPAIKARLRREESVRETVHGWLKAAAEPTSPMHEAAVSLLASLHDWGPPSGNPLGAAMAQRSPPGADHRAR